MSAKIPASVLAAWLCSSAVAGAQGLADPTRPPNVNATAEAAGGEPAANQLQSVLISRARKVAIINGQTVPLGGAYGEAVVAKISESEVVLKYVDHNETLKLAGDIQRMPVRKPRAGAKKDKADSGDRK